MGDGGVAAASLAYSSIFRAILTRSRDACVNNRTCCDGAEGGVDALKLQVMLNLEWPSATDWPKRHVESFTDRRCA
jgi:hypothetical protein